MTYSKKDLEALAQPIMEQYGAKEVYATSDGQVFLAKNRANEHAHNKDLGVYAISAKADLPKNDKLEPVEDEATEEAEKPAPKKTKK